jgi:hypothetical protein
LCVKHYKEFIKLVPTLSDLISGFEKFPSAMDNFIHAVTQSLHVIHIFFVLQINSFRLPQMTRDLMIPEA